MENISRAEAMALGLRHYYTGVPCKHQHVCERKVNDRSCVLCNKDKQKRHTHKSTEWYHNNKERAKITRHLYYESHKEEFVQRAREWHEDNPERSRELKNNWRRTEKGKTQSRNWVAENKEKHSEYTKDWKTRNQDKVYEYTGTRRAAKLQATPPWLTKEDRQEILDFYKKAKRLERETGVKHNVDHVVPLQHEEVCGLHVPWNLQVITESQNSSKGNSFSND